MTKMFQVLQI